LAYKCDNKGRSKRIKESDYQDILKKTFSFHLKHRLKKIKCKSRDIENILICYRYGRVKRNLHEILKKFFLQEGFSTIESAVSISMNGGGIDKEKLKSEITTRQQEI